MKMEKLIMLLTRVIFDYTFNLSIIRDIFSNVRAICEENANLRSILDIFYNLCQLVQLDDLLLLIYSLLQGVLQLCYQQKYAKELYRCVYVKGYSFLLYAIFITFDIYLQVFIVSILQCRHHCFGYLNSQLLRYFFTQIYRRTIIWKYSSTQLWE